MIISIHLAWFIIRCLVWRFGRLNKLWSKVELLARMMIRYNRILQTRSNAIETGIVYRIPNTSLSVRRMVKLAVTVTIISVLI
jgi:hypothetical protein